MNPLRFTREQVLKVLEPATYPLTTGDIMRGCRDDMGIRTHGGNPAEVRQTLDELESAGIVVSAKYIVNYPRVNSANPYQFIARPTDGRAMWWMTKNQADEFKKNLVQRKTDLAAAEVDLEELRKLLPKEARMRIGQEEIGGSINFELHGPHETMQLILAALKASQALKECSDADN